jgi:uncharacterized protein YjbJ (UPF0337 family)
MGRGKQTAGEAMDRPGMREEGQQEAAGAADDRASQHEDSAREERPGEATEHAESENT